MAGDQTVTVTVHSDAPDRDTGSLHDRLLRRDELRGRVRLRAPVTRPGTMGGITDTLIAALAPGSCIAVFVTCLFQWLRESKGRKDLSVTVRLGDDVGFDVHATGLDDLDDATHLLEELEEFLRNRDADEDGDGPEPPVAH